MQANFILPCTSCLVFSYKAQQVLRPLRDIQPLHVSSCTPFVLLRCFIHCNVPGKLFQGRMNANSYTRGQETIEGLPLYLEGKVTRGFGRGSKELGIPTGTVLQHEGESDLYPASANLPIDAYRELLEKYPVGVYYGWACVPSRDDKEAHGAAISIGWNPFYKNTQKTIVTRATPLLLLLILPLLGSAYFETVWGGLL